MILLGIILLTNLVLYSTINSKSRDKIVYIILNHNNIMSLDLAQIISGNTSIIINGKEYYATNVSYYGTTNSDVIAQIRFSITTKDMLGDWINNSTNLKIKHNDNYINLKGIINTYRLEGNKYTIQYDIEDYIY